MSEPTFEEKYPVVNMMQPILDALKELGGSATPREVRAKIADTLQVPEHYQSMTFPSGVNRFMNQLSFSRYYLGLAGYVTRSGRIWILTEKGASAFITPNDGQGILSSIRWRSNQGLASEDIEVKDEITDGQDLPTKPPEEIYSENEGFSSARAELLHILKNISPRNFEHICARLLRESGFDNITITGRAGDGGIDGVGVLEINPFLSLKIVFQCKRYDGSVSREQVSDFENKSVKNADKGIFITTGYFSAPAIAEATSSGRRNIELIDGERLVDMFIRARLGVREVPSYELDREFFKQYMGEG